MSYDVDVADAVAPSDTDSWSQVDIVNVLTSLATFEHAARLMREVKHIVDYVEYVKFRIRNVRVRQ